MRVFELFKTSFLTIYFLASASISHLLGGGIFQFSSRHLLLIPVAAFLSLASTSIKSKEFLNLTYLVLLIVFQLITHSILPYKSNLSDGRMFTAHTIAVITGYLAATNFDELMWFVYNLAQRFTSSFFASPLFTAAKQIRIVTLALTKTILARFIDREFSGLAPPFRTAH